MIKIALIDNYDSFTYNLVHLIERSQQVKVDVFYNDKIDIAGLIHYSNFVISPGPGLPRNAGIVPEFLMKLAPSKNILGICLGHQAIGEYMGCKLKNMEKVMHGTASVVEHLQNDILFDHVPRNFPAGRYHSWVIDKETLSDCTEVTATDDQGDIMAIKHKTLNLHGLQFHPESILSDFGDVIMKNWIKTLR